MPFRKRAGVLVGATFLVYALLVATHLGEFWPFSIYPMFSQAGRPWSRTVVRQVDADSVDWQPVTSAEAMPGKPFALTPRGIDPIDLANFVSKTEEWNADRLAGMRRMFHDQFAASDGASRSTGARSLLVARVDGQLRAGDSVSVQFVPYVLVRPDTVLVSPRSR